MIISQLELGPPVMQLGHAMMNDQKKNDRDRELFSELIEPPIHSNLIQVVPPFLEERNPVYTVQMSGEAAWKCEVFYWLPRRVFDSLQASILPLGYKLNESSCDRVGRTVSEKIRRFKHKMDSITSGKQRQKVRAETWVKITINPSINPEKIAPTLSDVLAKGDVGEQRILSTLRFLTYIRQTNDNDNKQLAE